MNREQFKDVVERYLKPMFAGTDVAEGEPFKSRSRKLVSRLSGNCELRIRCDEEEKKPLILSRSQPFELSEFAVVKNFVEVVKDLRTDPKEQFEDLLNASIRRVVAKSVCENREALIVSILDTFASWSEQTYEGNQIAAGIGIRATLLEEGLPVRELFTEDFGLVVSNGVDSIIECSADGRVVGHPCLGRPETSDVLSPLPYTSIAAWTSRNRIAIALNRNGEILVFKKQEIVFAKRRGHWYHFTHKPVIQRFLRGGAGSPPVRRAVYETCLDVSFARTGGTIAIIPDDKRRSLLIPDDGDSQPNAGYVLAEDIVLTDSIMPSMAARNRKEKIKTRWLAHVARKPFQDLARRLRQEVVAIDGATILNRRGYLIAAGAIVRVPGGSTGGGRLAAAKELGKLGLAVKISADGGIRGFCADERGDAKALFTICDLPEQDS